MLRQVFLLLLLPFFAKAESGVQYYQSHIKPIFTQRCIQCHSCYNAPCQLNLSSDAGLDRGLVNGFDVYSARKRHAAEPSRLGIDRIDTQGWRNFSREFHFKPVVQSAGREKKNFESSLIWKLIEHKRDHSNLTLNDLADPKLQAENSRTCPDDSVKLLKHLQERPEAGMPYGLPALNADEVEKIRQWTAMGSPFGGSDLKIPSEDLPTVRAIEQYFNRYIKTADVEKARQQSLVSRYIYEHLFLAHIYLGSAPRAFYSMIRSKNPCETGRLEDVATRRPWNKPSSKFFYCLKKIDQEIVHKTHITYLLDQKKLDRFENLFFSSPWKVTHRLGFLQTSPWPADLAPRDDAKASNPFLVYKDIPVQARYQFLLDDAKYHVMTFIKGPVCKGQTAVNSIDEQFYVFFLDPASDLMVRDAKFHNDSISYLVLPAHQGSDQFGGIRVGRYIRKSRNSYRELRDAAYGKSFPRGYSVNDIWNGQNSSDSTWRSTPNRNAALTVFRHHDSSAVLHGLIGATSKTSFVLDYSLFERLVYVLVTGFDVFGDVSHQVQTRLYMSYIKMEAEENFLSFFPSEVREPMRKSWYISSNGKTENIANVVNAILHRDPDKMSRRFPLLGLDKPTQIQLPAMDLKQFYQSDATAQETLLRGYRLALVSQFKTRLGPVVPADLVNSDKEFTDTDIKVGSIVSFSDFEKALQQLSDRRALNSRWILKMPSLSLILVEGPQGAEIYSMARTKEHYNVAWIASEERRRNRAADSLVFYKGVLGSYPNHIFSIRLDQATAFLNALLALTDHASYERWLAQFGNPRSGPGSERFWSSSDRLHEVFKKKSPREFGIFDFNRYGLDYRYDKDDDPFVEGMPSELNGLVQDTFGEE